MKSVNKIFYIIALMFSMACGMTTLPAQSYPQTELTTVNSMPTESVRMVAGLYPDEPLNIRNGAGGTETGKYLKNGDVVVLYHSLTVGDTLWCAIDAMYTRWVACRYLKAERN